jgi:hypothetical protein
MEDGSAAFPGSCPGMVYLDWVDTVVYRKERRVGEKGLRDVH